MKTHKLSLTRETLRSLTDSQLGGVNGMSGNTCICLTAPGQDCTPSCNPTDCLDPTEQASCTAC